MNIKEIPFIYKLGLKIKHYNLLSITKRKLKAYLSEATIKGLQIGSGQNYLKGWFNTDYFQRDRIYFLDATKQMPFPSSSFQYVFSEHHIEHIHYNDAKLMLKEIYRILKKDGVVRICTPNLSKYINAYVSTENDKDPYIDDIMNNWIMKGFHNAKNYTPNKGEENITFFVNDIFYNYEHKFIYDKTTLINLLKTAGFSKVYVCEPTISDYSQLNGIESHKGITIPFTLAVEAIK
jgi:predicted SAM-dependent methyltransferase